VRLYSLARVWRFAGIWSPEVPPLQLNSASRAYFIDTIRAMSNPNREHVAVSAFQHATRSGTEDQGQTMTPVAAHHD